MKWSNQTVTRNSLNTDLKRIGIAYEHLKLLMSEKLKGFNVREYKSHFNNNDNIIKERNLSSTSNKLNLRPFGLILEGLYAHQVSGWLSSALFKVEERLQLPSRLLIAQSEVLFQNRINFFNNELLPFLHPVGCENSSDESYISNLTSKSQMHESKKKNKVNTASEISNQKPLKLSSAFLSNETKIKLQTFYQNNFPVKVLFKALENCHIDKNIVKIVPSYSSWW